MSIMPPSGLKKSKADTGDIHMEKDTPIPNPVGVSLPRNDTTEEKTIKELTETKNKTDAVYTDPLNNYTYANTEYDIYNFNTATSVDTFKSLAGFIAGSRINVQYYWRQTGNGDIRTDIADNANLRSLLGRQYIRIVDYEITLIGGLQYDWDAEKSTADITGTAVLYPNLVPNIGDNILMSLENGQTTVFYVNSVTPSTYKANQTVYEITFNAYNNLSPSAIDTLEGCVIATKYFDKENFFGGTGALLVEDSYLDLQKLNKFKKILIDYYIGEFYDTRIQSFIIPTTQNNHNPCYDPYINKFINLIFPFELSGIKSRQLYSEEDNNYKYTIWNLLLQPQLTDILGVKKYYRKFKYRISIYSPYLTNLFGKYVLKITNKFDENDISCTPYVFTEDFYNKKLEDDSSFESLVYRIIKTRKYNKSSLFITTYLNNFDTLTLEEQFYHIPIYYWIIEVLIRNITRNNITK